MPSYQAAYEDALMAAVMAGGDRDKVEAAVVAYNTQSPRNMARWLKTANLRCPCGELAVTEGVEPEDDVTCEDCRP